MSFRLKRFILFVFIVCLFTTSIGCRHENNKDEQLVEITETKNEDVSENEVNEAITETETNNNTEDLKIEKQEQTETTTSMETNNESSKEEATEYVATESTKPTEKDVQETTKPKQNKKQDTKKETSIKNENAKKDNQNKKPNKNKSNTVSLGRFKLTAYCACKKCCGKSDGITATGTIAKQGRTIAVDPKKIPYGTKVIINGKTYVAEDCGGSIKGNRIDIFFNSHQAALEFGIQYAEVFKVIS